MKPTKRITALATAGTLLLPLGLFARGAANDPGYQDRQGHYQGSATTPGQHIQRVSESQLDGKVTADRLKGKKVVGRDGQKVGEVKHVGLSQAIGQSNQDRPDVGRSSMSTASSANADYASRSTSGSGKAMLYIEVDNDVSDTGDDLVSIPVSDAQFDQSRDEVKLQVTRQDLAAQLR